MNTLIVYASLHGCTKKCAIKLSQFLLGKVTVKNFNDLKNIDFFKYSNIIIGGSIHTGYINPQITQFCEQNLKTLLSKNIGMFLCFMDTENKFIFYLNRSFPSKLIKVAKVKGHFGGEIDFKKLTLFERMYIEKVINMNQSISKINNKSIIEFSERMNKFISAN